MADSGGRLRKRKTAKNSKPSTRMKMMVAVTRMKLNRLAIWAVSTEAVLKIDGVLKLTMHSGGQMAPREFWATARAAGIAMTATTASTAAARTMSQRRAERFFK